MKSPTKCFSLSLLCYLFIPNLLSSLAKVYEEPLLLRFPICRDGHDNINVAQTTASSTEFIRSFSIIEETGKRIQINANPGMTLARFQLQKLNASSQKLLFFILRQFYLHLVQYFAFHSFSIQVCWSLHNFVNQFFPLHTLLSYCSNIKTTHLCDYVEMSQLFVEVVQTYSIQRQK